jgi:hypothetical protein
MRGIKVYSVFLLLISVSFAGCISEDKDEVQLNLQVSYDSLNGTIMESYSDGELVSSEFVIINLDFSGTNSEDELIIFGVDTNDGRAPVEVIPADNSIISIEFTEHGLYDIVVYAIDDGNKRENLSLEVRIELTLEWVEVNTNNPKSLVFDPTPRNGGEHPIMIELESTVENPEQIQDFGGGQSVQITWNIIDENNDTCQRNSDQVSNGDSVTWTTIHFNTYLVHELLIESDDDQEGININQSISIIYNSD